MKYSLLLEGLAKKLHHDQDIIGWQAVPMTGFSKATGLSLLRCLSYDCVLLSTDCTNARNLEVLIKRGSTFTDPISQSGGGGSNAYGLLFQGYMVLGEELTRYMAT